MSPVVANAQNTPMPGQPGLPGVAANNNQPEMNPPQRMPGQPGIPPGMRPGMSGRPGMPPGRRVGMPGRPGVPAPAPRVIESNQPMTVAPSTEPQVIIYNGIRIGIPPNTEVSLSMDKGQVKIEAPVMDGISIGNAIYSTVDPSAAAPAEGGEEAAPAPAPVAATVFVNPADGAIFVPQKSVPVFVSVPSGDVIEVNPYISLKGDVSGALSQEAPVVNEPATETEPVPQAAPVATQTPPAAQETTPVATQSSASSQDTVPAGDTATSESFDEMEEYVAPTTVDQIVNDNINEQKDLSSSIRSDAGLLEEIE